MLAMPGLEAHRGPLELWEPLLFCSAPGAHGQDENPGPCREGAQAPHPGCSERAQRRRLAQGSKRKGSENGELGDPGTFRVAGIGRASVPSLPWVRGCRASSPRVPAAQG